MEYTKAQAEAFIAQIAPLIRSEAERRGYYTCASVIAQAIIESAAGTSGLSKYHNYFGLKCGSKWKGGSVNLKTKEEYKPGILTTIRDNFRTYPNMKEGIAGYYDFIEVPRYKNLKTATNYNTYAEMIKADGFATSSTYVSTLCNTVKKYNLDAWDKAYSVPQINYPTLRKGSTGPYVKELQHLLNKAINVKLIEDSIFGEKTYKAVRKYQDEKGLVIDGIVGRKTWTSLKNQ